MRKCILLLILGLTGLVKNTPAQTDNSIETISVSQGLPNAHVNQLFLGQNGLMWIGTSNGLCIYDGFNFLVEQSVPFDSTTLADDNILRITQDKNSNIWLLNHYGIEFIQSGNMSIKRVIYLPDSLSVVDIIPSPLDNYLYVIYKNRVQRINITTLKEENNSIPVDFNIAEAVSSVGFIYLMNAQHIARLNLLNGNIEKLSFRSGKGNSHSTVCLSSYDSDHLIFAIDENLYLYKINSSEIHLLKSFDEKITSLARQANNKIAVTTNSSISLIFINSSYNLSETIQLYTANNLTVNSLVQDNNNIIFAATNKGIIKVNPYSRLIQHQSLSAFEVDEQNIEKLVVESGQKGYIVQSDNTFFYFDAIHSVKYPVKFNRKITSCLFQGNSILIGSDIGLFSCNLSNGETNDVQGLENDFAVHSIKQFNDDIFVATNKGLLVNSGKGFMKTCNKEIFKFVVTGQEIFYTNHEGFGILDRKRCKSELLLNQSNSKQFLRILDIMQSFDGKIWLATEDGLYRFNPQATSNGKEQFNLVFKGKVFSLVEASDLPEVWFASDAGIGSVDYQTGRVLILAYEDGVRQTSFIPCGAFIGSDRRVNFFSGSEVVSFNPGEVFRNNKEPKIEISHANFVEKDKTEKRLFIKGDTILLTPSTKILEICFTTSDYFSPLHTRFEYSINRGYSDGKWLPLHGNVLSIAGYEPGVYQIKIKASNSHGVECGQIKEITLIVKASLLESRIAYFLYVILSAGLILLLIRFRTRSLMRMNREYKDKERIAKKIEQQKEELSTKNKNITDSINYARRIQVAMMPSIKNFKVYFPDSFILHMPKDIVSGDFYWVNNVGDKIFLSAVDCTGHGVPGAFMSIIGVELFRRITEVEKIYTPAEILNSLSKNFERVFGDVDEMKLRDGMDLAFCSINKDNTVLEFSGAFNPLYIIRDSSILEVKGDRQSVGVYHEEDEVHSFTNHVIPLQEGDLIYVFTDGFVDQFGGPEGKKYKYRRFRHLLLALQQLPMSKQEEFLKKSILEWKGEMDQVDDVLVIGLRIHQNKK
jgi:serine phosphatase RsbU (regulator of sigma subunit)/ligand-binding sensor domain-containing protein